MTKRVLRGVFVFVLWSRLAGFSADIVAPLTNAEKAALTASHEKKGEVTPGPLDGRIAFVTARLLESSHYLHQPFDETVSSKFFERYIEALDPQHLHFIKADLAEFAHYRTNLNRLTLNSRQNADTRPSCEIFQRFLTRLRERVAYCESLLKNEKFTFDSDDRIVVNRHELPYPKDIQEAKALWRDRLRFEYLQEHLAKLDARKKNPGFSTTAVTPGQSQAASKAPDDKPKTEAEEIFDTLTHRYHRTLRTFTDWDNDDVLQLYLTTLARVYDPHSDYFGHAQLESFAIGMNLSLFGIGAELTSEDGYCTIRRLLPGGPALKSKKIKEKDRIVAVAQGEQPFVDVVDMNLNKAVQLIRGPKDTMVRLKIVGPAASAATSTEITLKRDEIKLEDSAAKAKIIELPNPENGVSLRLGVIDLPSFYAPFDLGARRMELAKSGEGNAPKTTTADVLLLLKKLKDENVAGIILDLRRNGGGSLEEAIKLTGLFIKEGPVVQVRSFDPANHNKENIEQEPDRDPTVAYGGPLIVLTSKFSASASEILAGALQDYGRAVIVGDASTHGKGTVQSVNPLSNYLRLPASFTNDPGALKLTIKKFYRASGGSTQLKGVVPDIILPSIFNESKEFGESAQENPLPWDTIKSAEYEKLNLVSPYLTELRKNSQQRVAKDREYDYVREDIEQYRKLQADKTVSLNEKKRLKEKEELEARQKSRDKERSARKESLDKVYELNLKQAALPGLPAPTSAQKTNGLAKFTTPDPAHTNATEAAEADAPEIKRGDDADEEKPAVPDVALLEAEHILVDYISVLPRPDLLTAGGTKAETIR